MNKVINHIWIPKRILKANGKNLKGGAQRDSITELIHTSDDVEGIHRIRTRTGFRYEIQNKPVKDKNVLMRINSLVLPPAWNEVWICPLPNGHLQATGLDQKNRKQYRYHTIWMEFRGQSKFDRLYEFGGKLTAIRAQVSKDLAQPDLPKSKVISSIVSIMEQTTIRIGNTFYEKLYGSFGLSTFHNRHVSIIGTKLRFMFKGKKGVYHDISLKSRKLARIIQRCKHIPGKELFQYLADDGSIHSVESGDVNRYILDLTQNHFTSKDFRTWAGSVECLEAIRNTQDPEPSSSRRINAVIDQVAARLGNTRTVCRKYYIHPIILKYFEKGKLEHILTTSLEIPDEWSRLTEGEVSLMKLLKSVKLTRD